MTRVRVRGIYATALTALLDDAGFEVVQASPPIRRRFDATFPTAEFDVAVETTGDRQGVGVSGDPDAVDAVADALSTTGLDTFTWTDAAPEGAVFDGVVDHTVGGGAVVALGDAEGYLPFGRVDGHVDDGDQVRVQVTEAEPPWSGDRPVLAPEVEVPGGVATLVRGVDALVAGTPDGTPEHELARTTELLPTDVPDGWGVRWEYAAEDAGMDALDGALATVAERARRVDTALGDAGPEPTGDPGAVVAPWATTWLWFGRESRFGLDEVRRDVVPTMPGHHRIKAAGSGASAAVDFAERLGVAVDGFPFDAVSKQFGPVEDDRVAIQHGKPDGRLFGLGRGTVTDRDPETGTVTVRREMTGGGSYDALGVQRESGDVAVTKLREGRWWYPTVYRAADGTVKGSYVNVCTPVELFPDAARYVDLQVDVVKHADGTVEVVDEDDLQADVDAGLVSGSLAEKALDVANSVARGIRD